MSDSRIPLVSPHINFTFFTGRCYYLFKTFQPVSRKGKEDICMTHMWNTGSQFDLKHPDLFQCAILVGDLIQLISPAGDDGNQKWALSGGTLHCGEKQLGLRQEILSVYLD